MNSIILVFVCRDDEPVSSTEAFTSVELSNKCVAFYRERGFSDTYAQRVSVDQLPPSYSESHAG